MRSVLEGWIGGEPCKTALVTVLGLSPAVVTETLWALGTRLNSEGRSDPFHADEVYVLTTARGIEQVQMRLAGENGGFAQLCRELGRAQRPTLTIEPIRAADGKVLDDIRGADNSALGDSTTRLIGRPRDELSHVLLHDERFEFCRDFWCPTKAPTPLSYRRPSQPLWPHAEARADRDHRAVKDRGP